MRIAEFNHSGGVVNYPDDQSLFKNTKYHNGKIIGEYYGSDNTIVTYSGNWPISESYKKQLSKTDFKGSFAPATYRAISVAAQTDDVTYQFWDMAQTADIIDLDDPRTQQGMAYLLSQGTITQQEHDTIMLGKPE